VINLSADKRRVLAEAFRVLKPGGRFAVSDIVRRKEMPERVARSMELWAGCIAGALGESEYADLLREAGFETASVEPTRIYRADDARSFLADSAFSADEIDELVAQADEAFASAFIRAKKKA
jgi:SAM-dependent methyltransferase